MNFARQLCLHILSHIPHEGSMKSKIKLCALFAFFLFSTVYTPFAFSTESEQNQQEDILQPSPFLLSFVPDTSFLLGSAVFYGATFVYRHFAAFPDRWEEEPSLENVNALDRLTMRAYSYTFDTVGTLTCALNLAVFPVTAFAGGYFFKDLALKEVFSVGVMYAEAVLFASGVKDSIKMGVKRLRPYMYFKDRDARAAKNYDYEFSFPSGHTLYSFLGAGFLSYTFCSYFPSSKWKVPVVLSSYAVAVATGALRLLSGNHFITDVAGGAVLGSIIGLGVPFIHALGAKISIKNTELSFASPAGPGLFAKISL